MQFIGFISTLCLAICSFPLFWETLKNKHCRDIPASFVYLWVIGDIFGLVYVGNLGDIPLICNYGFNCIMASTMLYYKVKEG